MRRIGNCGHQSKWKTGVFLTTPDNKHNRLAEKYDAFWCDECLSSKGIDTPGKKLHKLNNERKTVHV